MIVDTVFLEKGLKAAYDIAASQMVGGDVYARILQLLATEVPSTGASEKYPWMGDVPAVREWLGNKQAGTMTAYDYTISNKDWEVTIDIDRDELEDDQLGRILPRIQLMAQRMRSYKGKRIAALLAAGTTGLSYDGSAFFANRTSPNDNLLGGTGETLALIKVDIQSARAAMQEFTSDKGEVMGLEMDTLVVPSALEALFLEAVKSTTNPGGDGAGIYNPANTWIKNVICLPGLSDQDDWYGACSSLALKPFVYQNRKDVDFVLDDTQVKKNRKYIYSAEMRGEGGYGFHQMCVKVVNS
jgi:phage major head subunit gpT-like protein